MLNDTPVQWATIYRGSTRFLGTASEPLLLAQPGSCSPSVGLLGQRPDRSHGMTLPEANQNARQDAYDLDVIGTIGGHFGEHPMSWDIDDRE